MNDEDVLSQTDVLLQSAGLEDACLEPFSSDNEYVPTQAADEHGEGEGGREGDGDEGEGDEHEDLTRHFAVNTVFENREELINWVQAKGKEHGTVIIIGKSQAAKFGKAPRLWLTCEHSGKFRPYKSLSHVKKRKTRTKKTDCPFKIKGCVVKGTSKWTLKVESGRHNHPLANTFEGHSYVGKLKQDERKIVAEMRKGRVKPKNTLTIIKERDPLNTTGLKQISNARHRLRMTELEGRTQMHELMKHSETNVLKELFWSHPESVKLTKFFHDVLIMDATYKTNHLKWPFLQVIGVTSTFKSFTICQVLMEREKEVDFTWAMQRLRHMLGDIVPSVIVTDRDLALMKAVDLVFPETSKHLCRWHIAMKVKTKGTIMLPGNDDDDSGDEDEQYDWRGKLNNMWRDLVNSDTEEEFNLYFSNLERDFIQFPGIAKYLSETWLPHKTRFIAAWTDQHVHFGTTTTNRAEGSHSVLKHDLGKTCQHDFFGMWELIHPSLNIQISEVKASFEQSIFRIQHRHNTPLFSELRGSVSHAALDEILREIKFIGDIEVHESICGHHLQRTHGLPCAHELVILQREGRSIPLSQIHEFWKKLSNSPKDRGIQGVDYGPALELFKRRFASSTEDQKRNLVMKLMELAEPHTTCLEPPIVEVHGRGRPKGSFNKNPSKKDWSSKRNPSEFEYYTQTPEVLSQKKGKATSSGNQSKVVSVNSVDGYNDLIPEALIPYIIGIQNPKSDGNCGFRALCMALGKNERIWAWMRRQLIEELQSHGEEYKLIFGDEEAQLLLDTLTHFTGSAPFPKWMDMPSTGYLFASRFNVVLVQFSKPSCYTFLPLRTSAIPDVKVLGLTFVNDDHYLKLDLEEDCPIPEPVEFWKRFHHSAAMSWRTLLEPRIKAFKSLNIQGITQSETFEGVPIFVG